MIYVVFGALIIVGLYLCFADNRLTQALGFDSWERVRFDLDGEGKRVYNKSRDEGLSHREAWKKVEQAWSKRD